MAAMAIAQRPAASSSGKLKPERKLMAAADDGGSTSSSGGSSRSGGKAVASTAAPTPAASTGTSTAAANGQKAAAPAEVHKEGSKVLYWSRNHGIWTPARVLAVVKNDEGKTLAYNLDVKPGVLPNRIKKMQGAAPSSLNRSSAMSSAARAVKSSTAAKHFQFGEHVKFWSDTNGRWVDTYVKAVHKNEEGEVTSYSLTAKSLAPTSRVKASSHPADAAPPQDWKPKAKKPQPGNAPRSKSSGDKASAGASDNKFSVGDQVQYFSATKMTWLETVVEAIHLSASKVLYDVSLKKGVSADRIRESPGRFKVGEIVEYWSATESRWVQTRLQKLNWKKSECCLSVKPVANIARIRKLGSDAEIQLPVGAAVADEEQSPDCEQEEVPVPAASTPAPNPTEDSPEADQAEMEPTSQASDKEDLGPFEGAFQALAVDHTAEAESPGGDAPSPVRVSRHAPVPKREEASQPEKSEAKPDENDKIDRKVFRPSAAGMTSVRGARAKRSAKPVPRTLASVTEEAVWKALEKAKVRATGEESPKRSSRDPSQERSPEPVAQRSPSAASADKPKKQKKERRRKRRREKGDKQASEDEQDDKALPKVDAAKKLQERSARVLQECAVQAAESTKPLPRSTRHDDQGSEHAAENGRKRQRSRSNSHHKSHKRRRRHRSSSPKPLLRSRSPKSRRRLPASPKSVSPAPEAREEPRGRRRDRSPRSNGRHNRHNYDFASSGMRAWG